MIETSVDQAVAERVAVERRDEIRRTVLREAIERHRHANLGIEERGELESRIKRLKYRLGLR